MKALIDSKEVQVNDIPIILFSSVFDGVLQECSNRFQDFERISDTTRLVAYPHLVKTNTAPLNLQMELVELKNDVQFTRASPGWNSEVAHPACRKRRFLGTHQWQSALLVVGLPVANFAFTTGSKWAATFPLA